MKGLPMRPLSEIRQTFMEQLVCWDPALEAALSMDPTPESRR